MRVEHAILLIIIGVSELIALACLPLLWRSGGSVVRRIAWTVALFVPVVGPLMFGAFHGGTPGPGDGFPPPPTRRGEFGMDRSQWQ